MVDLIWNGKYDQNGQRVAPLRVALPFQTYRTCKDRIAEKSYSVG